MLLDLTRIPGIYARSRCSLPAALIRVLGGPEPRLASFELGLVGLELDLADSGLDLVDLAGFFMDRYTLRNSMYLLSLTHKVQGSFSAKLARLC